MSREFRGFGLFRSWALSSGIDLFVEKNIKPFENAFLSSLTGLLEANTIEPCQASRKAHWLLFNLGPSRTLFSARLATKVRALELKPSPAAALATSLSKRKKIQLFVVIFCRGMISGVKIHFLVVVKEIIDCLLSETFIMKLQLEEL